jgi:polyribonucleotide nucleotidyltransferase
MPLLQVNQDLLEIAYRVAGDRIEGALYTQGKVARAKAIDALREEVKMSILEKHPEADKFSISQAFDYVQKKAFRISVLDKRKRVDGRGYQDLRPIACEVSVLPRAHGSAIFQRGETQALALATLAPIEEAQMIDAYGGGEQSKRFILHYNFPPFSVGETGRTGGRAGARLATERWRSDRSNQSCRAQTIFDTPFAFPARSWNPTDRHPWRACAAACSR